jgi:hypothetical protein
VLWGEMPSLRAAASTMGLKELPGWCLAARAGEGQIELALRARQGPYGPGLGLHGDH